MFSRIGSNNSPPKRITLRASGLALGLVAVLLTVSCASSSSTESAPLPEVSIVTEPPNVESPASGEAPAAVTEAPAIQPVVTPRGDALEATDPATVSLASGGLQLVEFFRFT